MYNVGSGSTVANTPSCCQSPSLAHISAPFFFFFNDTATTEIYTLSLHDALPILRRRKWSCRRASIAARRRGSASSRDARRCRRRPAASAATRWQAAARGARHRRRAGRGDRKSTRLNSSHLGISYAVFCLKKKTHPTPVSTTTKSSSTSPPSPPHNASPPHPPQPPQTRHLPPPTNAPLPPCLKATNSPPA